MLLPIGDFHTEERDHRGVAGDGLVFRGKIVVQPRDQLLAGQIAAAVSVAHDPVSLLSTARCRREAHSGEAAQELLAPSFRPA
jgi:hypothetical protein